MKIKCAVHHNKKTQIIKISQKNSLLEELRAQKIPIPFSCGGEGICTTCRILLVSGNLSPRTPLEQKRAVERNYNDRERLSCQCRPVSESIEIKIP